MDSETEKKLNRAYNIVCAAAAGETDELHGNKAWARAIKQAIGQGVDDNDFIFDWVEATILAVESVSRSYSRILLRAAAQTIFECYPKWHGTVLSSIIQQLGRRWEGNETELLELGRCVRMSVETAGSESKLTYLRIASSICSDAWGVWCEVADDRQNDPEGIVFAIKCHLEQSVSNRLLAVTCGRLQDAEGRKAHNYLSKHSLDHGTAYLKQARHRASDDGMFRLISLGLMEIEFASIELEWFESLRLHVIDSTRSVH
ncbi:MAG: hypothetical protein EOP84_28720 [Verrucomicrobiaceae bacterium]|nr:MAG: hypothetical protein EOP84_28720 [Verrucomicrobiaceae bacterium]